MLLLKDQRILKGSFWWDLRSFLRSEGPVSDAVAAVHAMRKVQKKGAEIHVKEAK